MSQNNADMLPMTCNANKFMRAVVGFAVVLFSCGKENASKPSEAKKYYYRITFELSVHTHSALATVFGTFCPNMDAWYVNWHDIYPLAVAEYSTEFELIVEMRHTVDSALLK